MKRKMLSSLLALSLFLSLSVFCTPQANAAGAISSADIVSIAKDLSGKYPKYVSGGISPANGGFDCTGLIYYIYHTQLGHPIALSTLRSKSALAAAGTKITNKADLLPGDIVQYTIFHVGIYIGNNTVVHAGSTYGVCKISLNSTALTFSYGIRLPNIIQGNNPDSDGGNQTATTPTDNKSTKYADCNVEIACFNGQTVNLYSNPGDTSRVTYFSKGQTVKSAYCATLSDGSTWYRVNADHNGTYRTFWLKYEPSKMTVTPIRSVHTVNFNANGGSVSTNSKQVTAGGTYGELPTPTRSGYIFDGWYTATSGGTQITSSTTVNLSSGQITLYAHWSSSTSTIPNSSSGGYWGPWSEWSTNYVEKSDTRHVETRQVKVSDEHVEYRYGRFIDSTGTKANWCKKYLESWSSVSGSASLQYTDWSTIRYTPDGTHWGCGFCNGDHIGVDFISADSRAWWARYALPQGYFYWEETKTVEAQYETQYCYRDWIPG